MNTSDIIAVVALVMSGVSTIIAVMAIRVQKKLNTTNLQSVYYENVFKDYLMKKIPNAAHKLEYGANGKLAESYKELAPVLLDMLEECAYFAYANHDFYEKLRDMITDFEEKLVLESAKITHDKYKQAEILYNIHEEISDIFKYINKNYSYCN